jgi:hypothetical protein
LVDIVDVEECERNNFETPTSVSLWGLLSLGARIVFLEFLEKPKWV